MRVGWTPLAERRVADAFAYIANDRPSAARRWLERLLDRVDTLKVFPDGGRMVPEAGRPEIRELIVRPYRVVYRRDPNRVVILTVRHSRQAFSVSDLGGEV